MTAALPATRTYTLSNIRVEAVKLTGRLGLGLPDQLFLRFNTGERFPEGSREIFSIKRGESWVVDRNFTFEQPVSFQLREFDDIGGSELVRRGEMREEGIGLVEAPRGTLFHHYRINEEGLVTKANLIVSTTNNNQAMNEAIRDVAVKNLDGHELTEPLLNQIEVAIRVYDPCLSCATHALGKMPLEVELLNARGETVDKVSRGAGGLSTCGLPLE